MDFNSNTQSGFLDFGYIDTAKYTGALTFVTSVMPNLFTVPVTGYFVKNVLKPTSFNVIIDVGASDSRVPKAVADAYYAQIPGAAYDPKQDIWQYPCKMTAPFPDFVVQFASGGKLTWAGADIKTTTSVDGNVMCWANIRPAASGTNMVWGKSFIQSVFVVFDYDHNRVGFGRKSTAGSPAGIAPSKPPPPPAPNGSVSN